MVWLAGMYVRIDELTSGQRGNSANSPGLCDISFCVPPGQRVAIVGESGTGKTTLVEVLLQAIKPDKGQVRGGPCGDVWPSWCWL